MPLVYSEDVFPAHPQSPRAMIKEEKSLVFIISQGYRIYREFKHFSSYIFAYSVIIFLICLNNISAYVYILKSVYIYTDKIETTDKKPTVLIARLATDDMNVNTGGVYNMKIGLTSALTATGKIFNNFVVIAFQTVSQPQETPITPFEVDDELPF